MLSVSESSSGESNPEVETPAMEYADLPQPLIAGVERLALDSPAAGPELADMPTPKHKTFNRPARLPIDNEPRPLAGPRSPTKSTRSGHPRWSNNLLNKALGAVARERSSAAKAPASPSSPTTPTGKRWGPGHRRNGSHASKASTTRGA